ncbi:beta-N-acetylglucosaminidase domain-containing protein [Streptomyces sp. NBC_01320]|uniref:beta-N-acetylglucosaminidase domain-containing protein n=1 Tax=Streptomyces sp. NBC_01320 TaxID=2903824 RepID=UPI002E15A7D1|nr:protein O-GlcNAcase [Streptomyces sp. NBC_01320]
MAGITANPVIQPYASKPSLYTVADYSWNDAAYDERGSWLRGLKEYAGGDARTEKALRAFADINYSSVLNKQEAPDLAGEFARYWQSGDADRLTSVLRDLGNAPGPPAQQPPGPRLHRRLGPLAGRHRVLGDRHPDGTAHGRGGPRRKGRAGVGAPPAAARAGGRSEVLHLHGT